MLVEISNLIGLFFVTEPPSTTTQKTISPPGNRAANKIVVSSFLFASMHQSDGEYLLYTKTKQILKDCFNLFINCVNKKYLILSIHRLKFNVICSHST